MHGHPPLTPAGVLLRSRVTIPLVAGVFVFLALAAAIDESMLRRWDEPVSRFLMDLRSPGLDGIVKALSGLGGLTIVTLVLVLLLLLVWHECRSLALVLLAASVARPLLEWSLKALIDRPRPNLDRIVPGNGPSFPSGHVMAAIAIWGLLPPVVAVVSGRRAAWWWSVGISTGVIVVVGFSRVYLGVHWMSDVIGALLLGMLYLLAVEWLLDWHHRRRPCTRLDYGYGALELRPEQRSRSRP
ncbi:MAG TPA: phosphatase PAP2 family protein [Acidimicrobiales bacterium]|nr:phosphatase PAP2 family protein [Acidimicrobiales bacterium]